MKKMMTLFGILTLVGMLASPAMARGPRGGGRGWDGGPGSCWKGGAAYEDLTEDQRNELNKLNQEFFDKTLNLRREIRTKSDEFKILLNAPDPDPAKVKTAHKEISRLKGQMAEHRIDHQLKARKIAPEGPFARGYGRRHMKGFGSRGGAYGPGACWK